MPVAASECKALLEPLPLITYVLAILVVILLEFGAPVFMLSRLPGNRKPIFKSIFEAADGMTLFGMTVATLLMAVGLYSLLKIDAFWPALLGGFGVPSIIFGGVVSTRRISALSKERMRLIAAANAFKQ